MAGAAILIVEDDVEMAAVLCQGFEQEDYTVSLARDGEEGLRMALRQEFRALVLDVMLPLRDGFEVAAELRGAGVRTPILMLTARDSVTDVVRGLDCGAEDYVTKPFSFLELSARLRALLRRGQPAPVRWEVADLVMDTGAHSVWRQQQPIPLTKTEFRVLEVLMRNAGHVVRRRDLIRTVWGLEGSIDDNNLDVTISAIRGKIDKGFETKLICTVRGFGYKVAKA
jgi:DNA-binding response OmpR family regulator